MNDRGGKGNLDNKRDEIAEKKWKDKKVEPPKKEDPPKKD